MVAHLVALQGHVSRMSRSLIRYAIGGAGLASYRIEVWEWISLGEDDHCFLMGYISLHVSLYISLPVPDRL